MSFSQLVRTLGRGPGRSRNLTREEACEAMRAMLSGDEAPEAVGALLMLMRYRGENPEEIAGFADGALEGLEAWREVGAGLDWPSYAAGKSRGLPLFLMSVKLVGRAGVPVMMHGWNSVAHMQRAADVRSALELLEIPVTETPAAARAALAAGGVAYVPLEVMSPGLHRLLRLRDVLGLRSAVNTTLRVMNPSGAPASVQGVFHPPYRPLQAAATELLGRHRQMALKGGGGEFERHPAKAVTLEGWADGARYELTAPALIEDTRRLADEDPDPDDLARLWRGTKEDAFAQAVVTGTAAAALLAAGAEADLDAAQVRAEALWSARTEHAAA